MNIPVIYSGDDWLVANKPAGMSMHREQHCPDVPSFPEQLAAQTGHPQLYPVHRLDKETSGLILLAITPDMADSLSRLFREREISKCYIALAEGKPKKKQGWIRGDMQKGRNGSWMLCRSQENPAITRFASSAHQQSEGIRTGLRLYQLFPHTGKTHQLRVAMKSLGTPILGDSRYKGTEADRCYLHASRLTFTLNGHQHEFSCPPEQGDWGDLPAVAAADDQD